MTKIVSIINEKGGVGKTTSTSNFGVALAEFGKKVLLIDFDPQGNLSTCLGINKNNFETTIYDALINHEKTPIDKVIIDTKFPLLRFAPSNSKLKGANTEIQNTDINPVWQLTLQKILKPIKDQYDYILIDNQPSMGALPITALVASDLALIPVEAEFLAMTNLKSLLILIEKINSGFSLNIETRLFLTKVDKQTLHSREVVEEVQRIFPEITSKTIIKHTVRFKDSTTPGVPLVNFDPESEPANAYRELTKEYLL